MQTVCFFPLSHFKSECTGQGNPVYRTLAHVLGARRPYCSSSEQYGLLWQLLRYDVLLTFIHLLHPETTELQLQPKRGV